MKIRTGAVVQGRSIEVEMDDLEGESTFKAWAAWDAQKRFRKLSVLGDIFVVQYLARESLISSEQASHRLNALQKSLTDD